MAMILSLAMISSLVPAVTIDAAAAIAEQFTLAQGGTYYFDLSSKLSDIKYDYTATINTALPDGSLKWVPFTYAGTVNAYSRAAAGVSTDSTVTVTPRSLFVSDYAVSANVSWDSLNSKGLIFGNAGGNYTENGISYNLRSLSMGSVGIGSGDTARGTPQSNEWDQVLEKNSSHIKYQSDMFCWGQDTLNTNASMRVGRSWDTIRYFGNNMSSYRDSHDGFRPTLEILNAGILGSDGIKTVTYDMGGNGKIGSAAGSPTQATVVYTGTLTLPEVSAANGFNYTGTVQEGMTLGWLDSSGNFYAAGTSFSSLSTGTTLTAGYGVTGVTISPSPVEIEKGSSRQFAATVSGSGTYSHAVSWTVAGAGSSGTAIDESGLLTIASDETASTLTVKAASVQNESKFGTAAVTVLKANQAAFCITDKPAYPVYGDTFTLNTSGGGGTGSVSWSVIGGATVTDGVVEVTGMDQVTITATKAGDGNYNAASDTYVFTPSKATPSLGMVNASAVFVGDGLDLSVLSRSDTAVAGTLSWEANPGFSPVAGNQTATYSFTPTGEDAGKYNPLTGQTVSVAVSKRNIISVLPQIGITDKDFGVTQGSLGLPAAISVTVQGVGDNVTRANIPVTWSGYNSNTLALQTLTGALNLTGNGELSNPDGVTASIAVALRPLPTGDSATPPSPGAPVIVNGEIQNAGTLRTTTNSSGQTTTTVTVDTGKLENILVSQGTGATVAIPITGNPDVAAGTLTGAMVKSMESKAATLIVQTDSGTYTLPAAEINIDAVSKQLGTSVSLSEINVTVSISVPSASMMQVVENAAQDGGFTIMVPAVDYTITCTHGNQTVNVSSFNAYVERTIAIPDGVDPSKITTGVVVEPDGSTHHVPTRITVIGGKHYAVINSLTNSTYSVVGNPVEFSDVTNHWAKDAINDMGSRLVVTGVGNNNYTPDRNMTRAEFATIMVRALGLEPGTGASSFGDVASSDWYSGYTETAASYGIVKGYDNGNFGPNDTITREQAMTMIDRAMKITGLKVSMTENDINTLLGAYTDVSSSSDYAKGSIAACLKTGITSGTGNARISPKADITRAEVAVMVQRLLQKSGLI